MNFGAKLAVAMSVFGVLAPDPVHSEIRRDLERELELLERGIRPEMHIAGAKSRVAVFTFEDPDGTGLGDALAALVGREVLLRSQVSSIGVIRYEGRLSPVADETLSYFDKVDRVTEAQQVTLSVWGRVGRDGNRLVVDTYVQIPEAIRDTAFSWTLKLPRRMGGGFLRARLRPERILVERLEVDADAAQALRQAARRLDELRPERSDDAIPTAVLPVGSVYWFVAREGPWTRIKDGSGHEGWVRTEGHCTGGCEPLLEAGRFAGRLVRFAHDGTLPEAAPTLSDDARAIQDQLRAFEGLRRGRGSELRERVEPVIQAWLGDEAQPGGAAFANIRAILKTAEILAYRASSEEHGDRPFDDLALSPEEARAIAFELARASLDDPRNADVLHNLATLFAYAKDVERAGLARKLEAEAEAER